MIDYHRLRDWSFPDIEQTYTTDESMLYALAIGLGEDPCDEQQLKFVNDVRPDLPIAFPTMAVVLGYPGSWMADPKTGITFAKVVHGEETLVMHRPLPVEGQLVGRTRVTGILDKGAGKGAVLYSEREIRDASSEELYATLAMSTFCRGDGGFSQRDGITDQAPPSPATVPTREPDRTCSIATLPQQALLYRLCADRNPLHSQPDIARAAGFDRPILHGLCTYGIAARAVLAQWCNQEPRRLKSLFARFSSPVYPGETLHFDMYREGSEVLFRARVAGRDKTVLDCGRAEIED